jgi:YD repeat-containing protein
MNYQRRFWLGMIGLATLTSWAWAATDTYYAYNSTGEVGKTWVKADGTVVSASATEYDVLGRQTKVTQAIIATVVTGSNDVAISAGASTETVYDVAGNVITKKVETDTTDEHLLTVYVYDDLSRQTTVTGPSKALGNSSPETQQEYDSGGNVTKQYVRIKEGTTLATDYALTQTEYDAANRAIKVTDAVGTYRLTTFDSQGRAIREYVYAPDNTPLQQSRTEYDHAGRVIRRIRMAVPGNTDGYDVAVDMVTEFAYDQAGRVVSETTYDSGSTMRALVTRSEYDGLGRLTKRFDPKNSFDRMEYDEKGFITKQTRNDGQGHDTVMVYDNRGRMLHSIAKGTPDLTTFFYYDGAGRRTRIADPNGSQTYYDYDLAGRQTKVIEDYGAGHLNRQTDYVFSKTGMLWQQVAHNDTGDQTTVYGFSNNNQVETITYPGQSTPLAFDYYPNGAVSHRTDQASQVLEYFYDARGLLLTKRNPAETYLVRFDYDYLGRMVTAKKGPDDPDTGKPESQVVYEFDNAGRLTNEQQLLSSSAIQPARDVVSQFDQVGSRTRLTYPQ